MPFLPLNSHPLHKEAKEIMAIVKSCGASHVTIAGGFVRDFLAQKPIADVDVFYQGDLDEEKVKAYFSVGTKDLHNYDDGEFHVTHPELYLPGLEIPIQLIKVNPTISLSTFFLINFGCELSKCWIEDGLLYYTPKCYLDFGNKKLTFSPNCSIGYKCKLIDKFPDFYFPPNTFELNYDNGDWAAIPGGIGSNTIIGTVTNYPESTPVSKPEIRILNR